MKIKGFDKNLKCRGFQFEIGKEYKIELNGRKLELCTDTCFHYCDSLQQVHEFYSVLENNRFCEIEVLGEEISDGEKCGSNHIKIVREIVGEELNILKGLVNGNSGIFNSGSYNSGKHNSGSFNSGDHNSGIFNSGDYNSGNFNSGSHIEEKATVETTTVGTITVEPATVKIATAETTIVETTIAEITTVGTVIVDTTTAVTAIVGTTTAVTATLEVTTVDTTTVDCSIPATFLVVYSALSSLKSIFLICRPI